MNDQGPHHETLKQKGQHSAEEVKDAAREQAESAFYSQRDNAAKHTHTFGTVLKNAADEFDRQDQPFCSEQARKLADHTERFSQHLRDKDLRTLCRDAEEYGRREPALFIGGAIAAGFLVTRFLRSSPAKPSASTTAASPTSTSPISTAPTSAATPAASSEPSRHDQLL
ncbi:hypothetical protein [Halomonas sp. DWK9]|uniref:hypothetical protein n=1 Tax=Halomonas sp. DWK9 TaxID=3060155 RepID=UPI00287FD21B|nr:hypothetical protein [Halomonas sp. DWK9]